MRGTPRGSWTCQEGPKPERIDAVWGRHEALGEVGWAVVRVTGVESEGRSLALFLRQMPTWMEREDAVLAVASGALLLKQCPGTRPPCEMPTVLGRL